MTPEIIHSHDFVKQAADLVEQEAEAAIAARGRFLLALSGGNTPKPVYRELAGRSLDWDKWFITFGDERCVPPDSEESNYRMAKESLFDHAPIPAANILRMEGELPPPEGAARYIEALRGLCGDDVPRHDLVLLGMGPDGHTASLFPGTPAREVTDRIVVENYVPKFEMWRITFTYPLLNAARHVCFLVSRKGKEQVLGEVLRGEGDYPCLGVRPQDGNLTWLIGE